MSNTASPSIEAKPSTATAVQRRAISLVPTSTIGSKFAVGITGLGLSFFVLAHMAGNLQVFLGPAVINHYAYFLQSNKELLWAARLGLLVFLIAHLVLAIRLRLHSQSARSTPYAYSRKYQESTIASRSMIYTGLVLFLFIVFHLAHFTMGYVQGNSYGLHVSVERAMEEPEAYGLKLPTEFDSRAEKREVVSLALEEKWGPLESHDVYSMVVYDFKNPLISGLYILAMVFLGMHMWHGVASAFQSLGANQPKWRFWTMRLGQVWTLAVVIGNIAIPVLILLNLIPVAPQSFPNS